MVEAEQKVLKSFFASNVQFSLQIKVHVKENMLCLEFWLHSCKTLNLLTVLGVNLHPAHVQLK